MAMIKDENNHESLSLILRKKIKWCCFISVMCIIWVFFFQFMRVELGVGIQQMKLLGDEEFFCQTEKEIRIYNLNQVCY